MSARNRVNNNNNGSEMNVNNSNGAHAAAGGRSFNSNGGKKKSRHAAIRSKILPAAAAAQRNNTIDRENLQKIIALYQVNEKRFKTAFKIIPGIRDHSTTDIYNYNHTMAEIHLQLYLIYSGYRKMAEVRLELPKYIIDNTIRGYLKSNNINYHIEEGERGKEGVHYLYLCAPRYGCSSDKKTRGTDVAKELGEFYTCQSEFVDWSKYEWRVVINCDRIELFAQMCPIEQIQANIEITKKVYEDIYGLFLELDRDRFGCGNDRFGHPKPNPLKIQIYRTKPKE
jgi:hypothetical protein